MSDEIIKILDNLGQKFGIVIDWTNESVLPYLQELAIRFINYRNAMAIMWIAISLITIIISVIVIRLIKKWVRKNDFDVYDEEYFTAVLGYFFTSIAILVFVIVLFSNIQGILQNIYMPELTIINYIKELM